MTVMTLTRLHNPATKQDWLIVEDSSREVMRLEWTDDLLKWMTEHKKEIDEDGDINVFLEYVRRRKKEELR